MSTILKPPPVVQQGNNTWWCWAAALSSWTKVCYGENIKPGQLVKRFQRDGLANVRGGIDPIKGIPAIAKMFYMKVDPPLGSKPALKVGGGSLSEHYLEPKLKQGHALVFYTQNQFSFSHTVVVYGVDADHLYYMDPQRSSLQKSFIYNFPGKYFLTMWRNPFMGCSRFYNAMAECFVL